MEKGFPEVTPAMLAARAAANGAQFRVAHSLPPSTGSLVVERVIPEFVSARSQRRLAMPLLIGLITCVAGTLGIATFTRQPPRAAKAAAAANVAAAVSPTANPAPLVIVHGVQPRPELDKPFTFEDVPRVPEAYTGDPAGQALWEQTVDRDQQTLQPEDLEQGPPRPEPDLRQYPQYRALNVDADGNLN